MGWWWWGYWNANNLVSFSANVFNYGSNERYRRWISDFLCIYVNLSIFFLFRAKLHFSVRKIWVKCHLLRKLLNWLSKSMAFENIWNFLKNRHFCDISLKVHKKIKKVPLLKNYQEFWNCDCFMSDRNQKERILYFPQFFPVSDFFYTSVFFLNIFTFTVWLIRF